MISRWIDVLKWIECDMHVIKGKKLTAQYKWIVMSPYVNLSPNWSGSSWLCLHKTQLCCSVSEKEEYSGSWFLFSTKTIENDFQKPTRMKLINSDCD